MERAICEACRRPMSAVAVRCPQCGAFQAARAPKAARELAAKAEAAARAEAKADAKGAARAKNERAPVHVGAVVPGEPIGSRDPDDGPFSGLISPHPRSTAGERRLQLALTLFGLPLILATFFTVGWMYVRVAARSHQVRGGGLIDAPGIASPLAWIAGTIPLAIAMGVHRVRAGVLIALLASQWLALAARRVVRSRARRRMIA